MKKVFIIDNEKFRCSVIEMVLKNNNYSSYTLQSSKDCLYLIEDIAPHALLVDIKTLTSENREGLIEELKNHETLSKIPLIATGTLQEYKDLNHHHKHFDGFIERPQSPNQIVEKLDKIFKI